MMRRILLLALALLTPISASAQSAYGSGVTPPVFVIPAGANGSAITPTSVGVPATTCAAPGIYLTTATTTGIAFTATPSVILCVNGVGVLTTTSSAVTSTVPYVYGTNPAASGAIRLPNAEWIKWRNNANGADLSIIRGTTSDTVEIGVSIDSGHILPYPGLGNTYDLGSASRAYRSIYLDTNLVFGSDVSLSRGAADLVIVGAGDAWGLTSKAWISTAPSGPVACTSPSVTWSNGDAVWQIDVGTSCAGISTLVVTLPAKTNANGCDGDNRTAPATRTVDPTAWGTTSITLTNFDRTTGLAADWTDGTDVIVRCTGG